MTPPNEAGNPQANPEQAPPNVRNPLDRPLPVNINTLRVGFPSLPNAWRMFHGDSSRSQAVSKLVQQHRKERPTRHSPENHEVHDKSISALIDTMGRPATFEAASVINQSAAERELLRLSIENQSENPPVRTPERIALEERSRNQEILWSVSNNLVRRTLQTADRYVVVKEYYRQYPGLQVNAQLEQAAQQQLTALTDAMTARVNAWGNPVDAEAADKLFQGAIAVAPAAMEDMYLDFMDRALVRCVELRLMGQQAFVKQHPSLGVAFYRRLQTDRDQIGLELHSFLFHEGMEDIDDIQRLTAHDAQRVLNGTGAQPSAVPPASPEEVTKSVEAGTKIINETLNNYTEGFREHFDGVLGRSRNGQPNRIPGLLDTTLPGMDFEDWWSPSGRLYMASLCNSLALFRGRVRSGISDASRTVGTAPLRLLPFGDRIANAVNGFLPATQTGEEYRSEHMNEVARAMGLPENFDFTQTAWENFRTRNDGRDWQAFEKRMRGVRTIIEASQKTIREKIEIFEGDLNILDNLRSKTTREHMRDVQPDPVILSRDRITLKEVASFRPEDGSKILAAYLVLYRQMRLDWRLYSTALNSCAQGILTNIGVAADTGGAANNVADNMIDNEDHPTNWVRYLVYGAISAAGVAIPYALGGRGALARIPILNTTLAAGRIPMMARWGVPLLGRIPGVGTPINAVGWTAGTALRTSLRWANGWFSLGDRMVMGTVRTAQGQPGNALRAVIWPGWYVEGMTRAQILENFTPLITRFRTLQETIAGQEALLASTSGAQQQGIRGLLEGLYAERTAMQTEIAQTLTIAERVMPAAEAELIRVAAGEFRSVARIATPPPAPAAMPTARVAPPIAEPIPEARLAPSIAEPVIPEATRAPSAQTVAEANRLRGIARFRRGLSDGTKIILANLTEASKAEHRYLAGISVLGNMGERGQNTITALRTLTPAEVEIVSNAVLNAHQLGRDISFFEAKIEMLVALQEHPTIGPKLLGKWQVFREAFIRSGICGSSVEVLASPAAMARLTASLRAALVAHVTTPQGLHILELCETPAFLETLNALPEAQLPRVLRVLGSAPMAAIDIAAIDPAQLAKMVRLFGSGTPAELRGFFGILRQSGALPEAAALMSQEARVVMLLGLQEAEFSRILTLCGESLEARAAVFAITDAARLRALATHLAEPSVVALLRTRGANIGEAITILSDTTRAAEAAALVREAQAAGTLAGRSRILATLARGGRMLRNIGSTGLGVLHRANPVLMPLAIAGEAYTMYDNEQANQSIEVAHKTLEQSMRVLLGSSFTPNTTPEGHIEFVHTSGVRFDMTKMISDVEALRGSNFIRRTTDIAAIIGAYAMLFGAPGMVAGGVLMAGSFITRELQAPAKARLWRSFISDLPRELLSIVPSNIFGGDRLDNFQLYVFLRSHPGSGSAYVNTPALSDTPGNNVLTRREEELRNDDVLQRVVLRSFVQECEKQQLPAQVMQERPGETLSQSVMRDIEFLHRVFAQLFTNETPEGYQNAVTEAVALWKRQRLAIFVERGRAQLAVSQDDVRGNLMRDLAPILEHASAQEPDAVKGSVASLLATVTPGSPEATGVQALNGDMLLPLELLEPAQALAALRAVGRLPAQDRTVFLRVLQILPDITVRAQIFERFGSQPVAVQNLILRACRSAAQAGGMSGQAHEALRALVDSAANSMPGGASFTVGEYLDRSARGQTTPGYAPRPSTGGLSSGAVAASRRFEMYLPVNEQFQDIDRLVRGILEQMGARPGRTTLSADGNSRVEATGGAGLDCRIAMEGTGPNAPTYFFHYNPETRRWFWATNTRPDFIPINQTLDLRLPREARDPRRYILDQRLESYRPPAILDQASVMERMAQYAPHPQAARVWELASHLIQRNNGSDGAQIIPATFPGGIEGFRYVYQGKEIQLASIGGWIRWKSPSQQSWSFVGSDLYPNPQSNSPEQWFNTLSRQLSGLQEGMRTEDRAKRAQDAGAAFARNTFAIPALVQIDGHPGFRVTEQGRTLEAICMGGLWFFHLNTGSPWADPALQSPAESYRVLRPVTSALARMNASAEPIEAYAALANAKMGGEAILHALSERGQKAVGAYDADSVGRIERGTQIEMQPPVPFNRDLVALGIQMRSAGMTVVERQEEGMLVTRIGSEWSGVFVELRCVAGQWQVRLGTTADTEADRKAQETTGEWVAIATGGQMLQGRVKILRSTLREPVMELGRSAASSWEQSRNGDSRIPFADLRSYDAQSRAVREARFKEAQVGYRRGLAEAQFLDNCIVVVGRVTAVSVD